MHTGGGAQTVGRGDVETGDGSCLVKGIYCTILLVGRTLPPVVVFPLLFLLFF